MQDFERLMLAIYEGTIAVDIRHDLEKLYALAVARGLSAGGANELIKLLSEHHKNFGFRYMKPDSVYPGMDLCAIFSAFSSLDNVVDATVGASVSRGKRPGGSWVFPSNRAYWRVPA